MVELKKEVFKYLDNILIGNDYSLNNPLNGSNIEYFHLSCRSTNPKEWIGNDIGGIVIYNEGIVNGVKFKPGYVYVKKIDDL